MRIVSSLALVLLVACRAATHEPGNLEQLVQTCQAKTGANFTYTDDTAELLRAHTFELQDPGPRSTDEWLGMLRTALAQQKLEIERIGPEQPVVWLVRPARKDG